jgi:hypothetical protein
MAFVARLDLHFAHGGGWFAVRREQFGYFRIVHARHGLEHFFRSDSHVHRRALPVKRDPGPQAYDYIPLQAINRLQFRVERVLVARLFNRIGDTNSFGAKLISILPASSCTATLHRDRRLKAYGPRQRQEYPLPFGDHRDRSA